MTDRQPQISKTASSHHIFFLLLSVDTSYYFCCRDLDLEQFKGKISDLVSSCVNERHVRFSTDDKDDAANWLRVLGCSASDLVVILHPAEARFYLGRTDPSHDALLGAARRLGITSAVVIFGSGSREKVNGIIQLPMSQLSGNLSLLIENNSFYFIEDNGASVMNALRTLFYAEKSPECQSETSPPFAIIFSPLLPCTGHLRRFFHLICGAPTWFHLYVPSVVQHYFKYFTKALHELGQRVAAWYLTH